MDDNQTVIVMILGALLIICVTLLFSEKQSNSFDLELFKLGYCEKVIDGEKVKTKCKE